MGICARQGLGKLRHIDTHTLWVQQAVRTKRFTLHKVDGEADSADLFSKHSCSRDKLEALVGLLGCQFRGGRAEAAPNMRQAEGTKTTMAAKEQPTEFDINNLETWDCMPHLMTGVIEQMFPAAEVPAANSDADIINDEDDLLWRRGLAIGEDMMRLAAKAGRRRIVRVGDEEQGESLATTITTTTGTRAEQARAPPLSTITVCAA